MNNVFVYCELEGTTVADVSLELLTKGRKLANQLNCQLEAIIALWCGQGAYFRCSGSVPVHFPSSFFCLNQFVQRRKTADLPDGSYGYRTRLRPPCFFCIDKRSDCRLYIPRNRLA